MVLPFKLLSVIINTALKNRFSENICQQTELKKEAISQYTQCYFFLTLININGRKS